MLDARTYETVLGSQAEAPQGWVIDSRWRMRFATIRDPNATRRRAQSGCKSLGVGVVDDMAVGIFMSILRHGSS